MSAGVGRSYEGGLGHEEVCGGVKHTWAGFLDGAGLCIGGPQEGSRKVGLSKEWVSGD